MGGKGLRTKAAAKNGRQPAAESLEAAEKGSAELPDRAESNGTMRQQTSRKAKRKFGHN